MLPRGSKSCHSVVNSSKSEDPAYPTLGCIWDLKSKLFDTWKCHDRNFWTFQKSVWKTHCTKYKTWSKCDPQKDYLFWSKWHPKMTLEVVPLKCASRQEKTPLRVPISTVFSSKMQLNVGEKRSTTATVKIMSGENWRELRPCGYPYSPREATAQFTASQETTATNCREFGPCQRLFFGHRPHSTQQSK